MGKLLLLVLAVGFAVYACNMKEGRQSVAAEGDPYGGLRHACKQFIERRELETRDAVWGSYWEWTVVPHAGGEFTVGARYAVGSATRYTSCIVQREGASIKLIKLTRMQ